jgi:predicted metal-binding transcription factor (methanogenesis marker protein 9)
MDPKPYTKTMVDKKWIKENGTDTVNLSETEYSNLPEDWKKERILGSEIVINEVEKKIKEKGICNQKDTEEIADLLHIKWLERNNMRALEEQKNRYIDMSEYEKEKDRIFVKAAISVLTTQ